MNRNLLLGAAAAGLLAGASNAKADPIPKEKLSKMDVVACYGVNTCKAKGSCSSESHGCAGLNTCKGTGWLPIPKDSCLAVGGSLTAVKK